MKNGLNVLKIVLCGLMLAALAAPVHARDTVHMLSIQAAMNTPEAQQRLDPSIRFIFADAPHGRVTAEHGNFVSNKKTNAFGKSDQDACNWVMLSALLTFQDRVRAEGGNAVINIESFYQQNPNPSRTEFECHAGAIMAGVALRGDVVTLAD